MKHRHARSAHRLRFAAAAYELRRHRFSELTITILTSMAISTNLIRDLPISQCAIRSVLVFKPKKSFNPKTFLAEIGEGRTIHKYYKDEIVFSQGDPADAVFYILKGQVKVTMVSSQGKEAVIAIHGAKNFFGQRCLTGVLHRIATVTTLTESVHHADSEGCFHMRDS